MEPKPITYLGDGVYATHDGFGVWLTTEPGGPDVEPNRVYLEPEVYRALVAFVEQLEKAT